MTFYEIIYNWVEDNFGESEANDPSWDIKALAKHLSESNIDPEEFSAYTKNNTYDYMRQHYLREDIEYASENLGVELTEQEVEYVINQYYKMEDETTQQLMYIIDEIKREK